MSIEAYQIFKNQIIKFSKEYLFTRDRKLIIDEILIQKQKVWDKRRSRAQSFNGIVSGKAEFKQFKEK